MTGSAPRTYYEWSYLKGGQRHHRTLTPTRTELVRMAIANYRKAKKLLPNETLGNLSHLPAPVVDLVRRALRGESFVPSAGDSALEAFAHAARSTLDGAVEADGSSS